MKERKYKDDWQTEVRWDQEKDREKRVPVYRGDWFSLSGKEPRKALQKARLLAGLLWLGYVGLLLVYFLLNFPGATTLYVFLPAALSLFPAFYWLLGFFALLRLRERMTRLQKENGPGRVLRSGAGCFLLSAAALTGDLVLMTAGGQASREGPGFGMLASAAILAFACLRYFRAFDKQLRKASAES